MKGKNKCKLLKQIRQRIAEENDIPYVTRECSYRGECQGTCPKCEAELRYLEEELEKRRRLGKAVAVAAVAAGLSLSMSACTPSGSAGAGGGSAAPTLPSPVPPAVTAGSEEAPTTEGAPVLEGEIALPTETEDPDTLIMGKIEADPRQTEPRETVYELEGDVVYVPAEELEGDVAFIPPASTEETQVPETTQAP